MEVWRRTDTEREGEEEKGRVRESGLRSQIETSEELEVPFWNFKGKESLV